MTNESAACPKCTAAVMTGFRFHPDCCQHINAEPSREPWIGTCLDCDAFITMPGPGYPRQLLIFDGNSGPGSDQ